jgi:predicted CDP-diglyceride synthetase/phosphatidate cytidylyltransferase
VSSSRIESNPENLFILLFMVGIHSLHDVHEMNAYTADRVCPSVSPHDSVRELLGGV